jgi:hypothetical protein
LALSIESEPATIDASTNKSFTCIIIYKITLHDLIHQSTFSQIHPRGLAGGMTVWVLR